jgi:hypothetical protein
MPALPKPTNGSNADHAARVGALFDAINTATTGTAVTVTSGSGTLTSVSGTVDRFVVGNIVLWRAVITITTNGTGATHLRFTFPGSITAADVYSINGIDFSAGGALTGYIQAGTVFITKADGTYPGGSGKVLIVGGWFRTT